MSNDAPAGGPRKIHTDTEADTRADTGDGSSYPHRGESVAERADRNFGDILQELRVVLSGTQIISGFLLAVAFQSGFKDLDHDEIVHYLVLVGLAALATLLGLAPVAAHRMHFAQRMKDRIVVFSNRMLIATLAVVALLMIGVSSFIFEVVVSEVAGLWAAGAAVAVLVGLFIVVMAARHSPSD